MKQDLILGLAQVARLLYYHLGGFDQTNRKLAIFLMKCLLSYSDLKGGNITCFQDVVGYLRKY